MNGANAAEAERGAAFARLGEGTRGAAQPEARVVVAAAADHAQVGGAGIRPLGVAHGAGLVDRRIAIVGPLGDVAAKVVDALRRCTGCKTPHGGQLGEAVAGVRGVPAEAP